MNNDCTCSIINKKKNLLCLTFVEMKITHVFWYCVDYVTCINNPYRKLLVSSLKLDLHNNEKYAQ